MTTDEERREVARRLRELEPCLFDDGEYIDCGEVESAIGLVSDDGSWYRADGVMRLADLIEPHELRGTHFNSIIIEPMEPPCDREALLALVKDLEAQQANKGIRQVGPYMQPGEAARRIREALGEGA